MSRPKVLDSPQTISLIISGCENKYLATKKNKSKYIRELINLDMTGGLSVRVSMLEKHKTVCFQSDRKDKTGFWSRRMDDYHGHGFKNVDEAVDWMDARL